LPADVDHRALATFTLTIMEGGVMLARTYRSIEPFDDSIKLLRNYVEKLTIS
jgi:hypothetical protein